MADYMRRAGKWVDHAFKHCRIERLHVRLFLKTHKWARIALTGQGAHADITNHLRDLRYRDRAWWGLVGRV